MISIPTVRFIASSESTGFSWRDDKHVHLRIMTQTSSKQFRRAIRTLVFRNEYRYSLQIGYYAVTKRNWEIFVRKRRSTERQIAAKVVGRGLPVV